MSFEMAQISNYNGSSLGLILVLFILLVIVTSLFRGPLRGGNSIEGDGRDLSIRASRRFDIYNYSTGPRFSLEATNLYGDFESPPPPLHTILLGRSYSFQVRRDPFYITQAFATYNVVSTAYGEIFGSFEIKMQIDTNVPSTQIISKIGDRFTLNNGNTYLYVENNNLGFGSN
ncbi:hypothetical protein [Paenibacillus herberti]|uniref:Uncharacterized protein n=1 Tax=Paenibacillus herberti TaxID=1619309 RepID=A0A229P1G0_9BACL|nr:hypothetical protein [Paenibacillus herberti]OXM15784.1 hypothetical protein CGZ75_03435 [Paenibacillus herberti]